MSHVIWLTGLSGSGKTTLAQSIDSKLKSLELETYQLDGDILRSGLCSDLKFSTEDRIENLRRAGFVAKILSDTGKIVIASFITPLNESKEQIKRIVGQDRFMIIHVDCPLKVCEARDVKGLYKLARARKITNFTGISSPYEKPLNPDIIVNTDKMSQEECLKTIFGYIIPKITNYRM